MNNLFILFCSMLIGHYSSAQSRTILVFDLINNTSDSFSSVEIDTSIHWDKTKYSLGLYNERIAKLEQEPPSENLQPGSEFTFKTRASDKFELTDYPIRTSIKIFNVVNDSFEHRCSGIMVSRRHVLSAAHCFSEENSSTLWIKQLYICPVYDYGKPNNAIHCSNVSKLYIYKNWVINGEDVAILELDQPIGEATGWVGIGYNDNDSFYTKDVYHKFSYPGREHLQNGDSTAYNGDTLYHSFGKLNTFTPIHLGSHKTLASNGESGSSILRIINDEDYTSYGVLSWSSFGHNRITNRIFNDFQVIIKDDLEIDVNANRSEYFEIYPNPAASSVTVKKHLSTSDLSIQIFNMRGELVFNRTTSDLTSNLDISYLADGIYFMRIIGSKSTETIKLIKSD